MITGRYARSFNVQNKLGDLAHARSSPEFASIPSSPLKGSQTMKVTSQVPTEPIAPTRIRPTGTSTGRATGEGAKPASSSLPAEETSPTALPSTGLVGTRINTSA
jgi:hypothetical protein